MSLIRGIDIVLHVRTQRGVDGFKRPVYDYTPVTVKNVLVTPAGSDETGDQTNMTGRMSAYTIHIPKGDTHVWDNTVVEFFGTQWRTVGFPQPYIGRMLPLDWDRAIRVEHHE